MNSRRKVAYFYTPEIGKFQYTSRHLMNPKRIAMAHNLVNAFGLYKKLEVYESREATKE